MTTLKINERIAFLRKEKGLTQEELAKALGVTNQAVSKWESSQCCPDIQLLPYIADFFNISLDELFNRKQISPLYDIIASLRKKSNLWIKVMILILFFESQQHCIRLYGQRKWDFSHRKIRIRILMI